MIHSDSEDRVRLESQSSTWSGLGPWRPLLPHWLLLFKVYPVPEIKHFPSWLLGTHSFVLCLIRMTLPTLSTWRVLADSFQKRSKFKVFLLRKEEENNETLLCLHQHLISPTHYHRTKQGSYYKSLSPPPDFGLLLESSLKWSFLFFVSNLEMRRAAQT